MNAKIEVSNVGIIRKTEVELGDLTVVCGENNSGKSTLIDSVYRGFVKAISCIEDVIDGRKTLKAIGSDDFKTPPTVDNDSITCNIQIGPRETVSPYVIIPDIRRQRLPSNVLSMFEDMLGGKYVFGTGETWKFIMNDGTEIQPRFVSDSIRSLGSMSTYIQYMAERNQIIFLDNPEKDLHPKLQRKYARFIARLVNCGVKVIMSTNSDYIVRELNVLISMNSSKLQSKQDILNQGKYGKQTIDHKKVRCYVMKCGEAIKMDVSRKFGMEITSFDETIRDANDMMNTVFWSVR